MSMAPTPVSLPTRIALEQTTDDIDTRLKSLQIAENNNSDTKAERDRLELCYARANAIICSVFNKYYNGSSRAVDPFVIKNLQEKEGPAEGSRALKTSQVPTAISSLPPFATRYLALCGGYFGGNAMIMCVSTVVYLSVISFLLSVRSNFVFVRWA